MSGFCNGSREASAHAEKSLPSRSTSRSMAVAIWEHGSRNASDKCCNSINYASVN